MATKFGRVGMSNDEFPSITLPGPLIIRFLQDHVKCFACYIITTTRRMTTKLDKVVTYYEKLQLIKSHNPLNAWSNEVMWQICLISTTSMPMATKPGRVVIYNKELPSIKSHNTLSTWPYDFDFSYTLCKFRTLTPNSSPTSCSFFTCKIMRQSIF